MYRWFYEGSTTLHFALFAMGLFIITFLAVVIRTFTTRHDDVAQLPLAGDDGVRHVDHEGGRHE
jgi:hypothetical protein